LQVIGSAGLLIAAKDRNLITEVEPLLTRLRASSLRLSDQLFDQVLEAANEK
jgi:predicted nucleic acid-binding protein